MKKIGFIGAFDKTDMIIYMSKILVQNNIKVLVVDATKLEKTRYTVPTISPSKCYITSMEGIDIAIGFDKIEDLIKYLGETSETTIKYDFIFIDVDENEKIEKFKLDNSYQNYFVTGFDNYSLQKGMEIIGKGQPKLQLIKIIFSHESESNNENYLNFISFYYAVKWTKGKIYFPFEFGDGSVIVENQRSSKISFMYLSDEYKQGLFLLTQSIEPNINKNNVKKILRNM